jgi:hypothetical protein
MLLAIAEAQTSVALSSYMNSPAGIPRPRRRRYIAGKK